MNIYYVWSEEKTKKVTKIGLEDDGQFDSEWPLGFFPERLEAAKELSKIRFGVL